MKILVDANIYLRFYENPKDKPGAVAEVAKQAAQLVFPEQIWREFMRNRGTLLTRSLASLKAPSPPPTLAFIQAHELAKKASDGFSDYKESLAKLTKHVEELRRNPSADPLWTAVKGIYEAAIRLPTTNEVIEKARLRMLRGDPPMTDEKKSVGDEIIWEGVLAAVTDDLIIVSQDKTFSSHCDFLVDEYRERTHGKRLVVTDKISAALREFGQAEAAKVVEKEEEEMNWSTPAGLGGYRKALYGTPCPRCKQDAVGLDPENLSRCVQCGFLSDDD